MSIIGNFKSSQDKEAKKNLQMSLLDLEVSNEAEREKRQKDFKNPYKPVAVPPQLKSNAELQKDRIEQERQAIANMAELGFDYQKGAELTAWLSSSLVNKLVAFNANFKGIKKELGETTNPKLLSLDYIKNYLEKYFEDMDVNYGRKFGRTEQSGTPAPIALDELEKILPDVNVIKTLIDYIIDINGTMGGQIQYLTDQILEARIDKAALEINRGDYADVEEYKDDAERAKKRIKEIDIPLKNLEKDLEASEKSRAMGHQIKALLEILDAVTPSPELISSIKTNLSQNERSDLIRRYALSIKKLKMISNAELNELLSLMREMAENDSQFKDSVNIEKFYRRILNSLSFLTDDSGVNALTKLQKDYEVLISQSGKPVNLEGIKKYTEVRDIQIENARQEFMDNNIFTRRGGVEPNAGELRDRFFKSALHTETKELIIKDIQESGERELAVKAEQDAMERRYHLPRRIVKEAFPAVQTDIENGEWDLDDAVVQLSYEDEKRVQSMAMNDKRAFKKYLLRLDEDSQIEKLKNVLKEKLDMPKAQIRKKAGESKENYLERLYDIYDVESRRQISNLEGKPEEKTNIRELGEEELYFKRLNDVTTNKSSFINALEDGYNLSDQAQIILNILTKPITQRGFNMNRADVKKNKGENIGDYVDRIKNILREKIDEFYLERTSEQLSLYAPQPLINVGGIEYGFGIKDRLRKHFHEDKEYLTRQAGKAKDIRRMITKHITETEPIEREISNTLDGKGLNFKHTRIKVGRGITAIEQPQYKTFGKYVIHYGHLIDRNIANFKYPSLGSIPAIKPVAITDDYKEFLIDTINNGKPNERILNRLSPDEKKHFERVVIGAGLLETFNLKRGLDGEEKKDTERFILLRGEVMAGNNNDKVIKELRLLIVKLISNGRIQRNDGTNMLIELSTI